MERGHGVNLFAVNPVNPAREGQGLTPFRVSLEPRPQRVTVKQVMRESEAA